MKYLLTITFCLILSVRVFAQESSANVFGHVRLENPEDAASLQFGMQSTESGAMIEVAQPDTSGAFEFPLLPFGSHDLYLKEQNQSFFIRRVIIESPVPVHLELDSIPTASTPSSVGAVQWQSHMPFAVPTISELPVANTVDRIESIQQQTPGMIPDVYERMHQRGEDEPPEFVLDGIPISSQMTRSNAPLFDASLVESADILRGGLGPQYGHDGIVNIATKSGFNATNFGHAEYSIGTSGNSSQGLDLGGRGGNIFAYYGSYGSFSTDRYLDPLTGPDPNHTNGSGNYYFGKLDILPAQNWTIRALGWYGASKFQVPNAVLNSAQDQKESLFATIFSLGLDYNLTSNSVLSAMSYTRRNDINLSSNGTFDILDSSSDQLNILGARTQDVASGGRLAYSAQTDWFGVRNDFNVGGELEIYPLSEYLSLLSLSPPFPDTFAYDRNPIRVDTAIRGKRISGYIEDRITAGSWIIDPGIRYDSYDLLDQQTVLYPRLNLAWHVSNPLFLRASSSIFVEQPPLENNLASTFSGIGGPGRPPKSEFSGNIELGANYSLSKYFSLDASGYYESLGRTLLMFQLENSGIFLPGNYDLGTISGGELELGMHDWNHLYGLLSVSACNSKATLPTYDLPIGGAVFGALRQSFGDAALGVGSFNTESSEPLSATFLLRYQPVPEFFALLDGRWDSGLPFGLADTNRTAPDATRSRQILESRGVNDAAINLLNLNSTSTEKSIASHAVFNFSIGYDVSQFGLPITIMGSVVNIFNTVYLDHFDPVAGGSYYGMGRSFLLEAQLSP